jgi:NTE family protein
VGALYADKPYADSLLPLMTATSRKDLFDFSIFRSKTGVISGKRLQEFVVKNVGVSRIEQTRIPFVAVATDIDNGKSVAFSTGPIAPAINASCAIPGFFDPVVLYGTTYIDGGILNNIPVDFAKEFGAKYIIAVDIMPLKDSAHYYNYKDVLLRALMVSIRKHSVDNLALADLVITPNLKDIPYMNTQDNQKTYEMGVEAAEKALEQIKKDITSRGIPFKQ